MHDAFEGDGTGRGLMGEGHREAADHADQMKVLLGQQEKGERRGRCEKHLRRKPAGPWDCQEVEAREGRVQESF